MFPSIASSSRRTGLTWRTGLRRSHINYTLRTIRFDRYGRYMRTSNIHSCLMIVFNYVLAAGVESQEPGHPQIHFKRTEALSEPNPSLTTWRRDS